MVLYGEPHISKQSCSLSLLDHIGFVSGGDATAVSVFGFCSMPCRAVPCGRGCFFAHHFRLCYVHIPRHAIEISFLQHPYFQQKIKYIVVFNRIESM
jgi:hypothetical protein